MTFSLDNDFFTSLENLKTGDTEFVLSGKGSSWFAAIGNKSEHVSLGEAVTYDDSAADFLVEGASAHDVLLKLRDKLIEAPIAEIGGAA